VLDLVAVGEPRELVLGALGDALARSGRPEEAVTCYAEALDSAKARGDLAIAGSYAHQLGNTHMQRSAWEDAARAFDEAAALMAQAGAGQFTMLASRAERLRVEVLAGRGAAARDAVDTLVTEMEALFEDSLEPGWKPEPDAPNTPAHGLVGVLDIRRDLANFERDTRTAFRLVSRQIEVERLSDASPEDIAASLFNRGTLRMAANDLDGAELDLREATDIFTQAGHGLYRAKCLSSLAQVAEKRGNLSRSVELELESLQLRYQANDLGDLAISHNNLSHRLTTRDRHNDACLHATAALLLYSLFRPNPWTAARNLQNALAAAGPGAQPPNLDRLEQVFPRLIPLLAARGLDRSELETHLTTVLAQRETLAGQAGQHDRRAQLVRRRGALEALAAGLQAGDAEAKEAVASDGFRKLLTNLGLSPDLPPADAAAAALAKVNVEIATIDASPST